MAEPEPLAASLTSASHSDARRDRSDAYRAIDAERSWRESGVPDRHRAKTLLRHEATGRWGEAYRRLKERLVDGPLIVLLGPRGTGKTQLAVDLLADVAMDGRTVRYLKALDLFREIRACYRPDGPNEIRVIDQLCRHAALVIDEAQERGETDWENRTLVNLVDRRYDAQRTTVLVSNLTREAFAEAVGSSIVSRSHECGEVVICDWPSFREPGGSKS